MALVAIFALCALTPSFGKVYPVPTPQGGRRDVHGWLVLPMEQEAIPNSVQPVEAWFSHHVPEFWTNSPHNWQIMLKGSLMPTPSVEGELYAIAIPHPPADDLVAFEYSFTPPSPFSLNDLLNGQITKLNGMYYNGSFDTPYERIPQSLATLTVQDLTTTVYLEEFESTSYASLRYLSYPRNLLPGASNHFYFAHQIHAQPDFDHIVHVSLVDCMSSNHTNKADVDSLIARPGASWEFVGIPNTLEHKLTTTQVSQPTLNPQPLFLHSHANADTTVQTGVEGILCAS